MTAQETLAAGQLVESVIDLTKKLVRIPSRARSDSYEPVVHLLANWFTHRGLALHRIHDTERRVVGCWARVRGGTEGPTYVLNATLDTAPFGDLDAWQFDPVAGKTAKGWLLGRGSADSKSGIAIFSHIASEMNDRRDEMRGDLIVLFDGDEHSGEFTGAKAFYEEHRDEVSGVMIGYPGTDRIVVGGRGFARFRVEFRAKSAHTGSSKPAESNSVVTASRFVTAFHEESGALDAIDPGTFGVPPKATVTSVHGGEDFTVVPGLTTVGVDIRLTPTFNASEARALVHRVVDRSSPGDNGVQISVIEYDAWPPFRTRDDEPFVAILQESASLVLEAGVPLEVVGPSNVGNYLATLGIPATAGFGVDYVNIHAPNEKIRLASVAPVFNVYLRTARKLFARTPNP